MSFVKLDCGILDSSLWVEHSDVRIVFITVLAMCNSEGLCPATAPGIARRANLPLSTVRRAIRRLSSSDRDDRSGVDEGRRLKHVNGGFQVVNYLHYRQKDHTATERKRRQRERARVSAGKSRVTSRNVTQADADAD